MATSIEQARYRAQDSKHLVQVRLTAEALERLDQMVREQSASGRAQIIEALLAGEHDAAPEPQPQPARVWLGYP